MIVDCVGSAERRLGGRQAREQGYIGAVEQDAEATGNLLTYVPLLMTLTVATLVLLFRSGALASLLAMLPANTEPTMRARPCSVVNLKAPPPPTPPELPITRLLASVSRLPKK